MGNAARLMSVEQYRGRMESPDVRWRWVEFLGNEIDRAGRGRRTLLGWAGSITAAVAIILWTIIALLETEIDSDLAAVLLMLVVVSAFGIRMVAALYPGGIGGLVDKVVGVDSGGDLEPEVLIDFISLNIQPLRSEVLKRTAADLVLVMVLVIVGVLAQTSIGEPSAIVWMLVALRLVVVSLVLAFALLFLTPAKLKVLTAPMKAFKEAREAIEKNPRLLVLYLKLVALERVGSIAWNSLYYGLQVLAAIVLVATLGGTTFDVLRLMLLAFVASLLVAIVWELWKTSRTGSVQIDYLDDLRNDILLGSLPQGFEQAYQERQKELQQELAEPFQIPESYWADSE